MTYVVSWSPYHRDPGTVELGCRLARSSGARLHVVSVLTAGWGGLGRRDASSSAREGDRAVAEARAILEKEGIEADVVWTSARSVPQALLDQVKEQDASLLILGSSTEAGLGRITVSSKADRLLHSSPVPIALAPRGHRADGQGVTRVTCAFRDEESSHDALDRAAAFADKAGVDLRVMTFGVQPRDMVPSEVSGGADMVLEAWRDQSRRALDAAVARIDCAHSGEIVVGRSWSDALHEASWIEGEILVVGSSSTSPFKQVFIGSSATKIVRHSPVPVVVMP